MNVLAIDQGTSSTKALVLGPDGAQLAEAAVPVRPRAASGGAVTQDPDELLDSVIAAGRRALARSGVAVGAVGVANQGETVLAWDRDSGRAHGPALSWQDRRAAAVTAELQPHAEELAAITGLSLDPYFAAPKMAWLRSHGAPRAAVVTTIDSWITHRLTGAYVTDLATASRTLLLDLDHGCWSEDACRRFGLDAAALPALVSNAQAIGTTSAFGPELPITSLIVDQQAALFAQGCLQRGAAKCTYGTGAFLLANAGTERPGSTSGLVTCVAWRLSDETDLCLDGQIYTAGAAIGWLRDIGLIAQAADLDRGSGADPWHEGGPLFVPALAGLGAPRRAPSARASWMGLSLASTREQLVDAVLCGIAAEVAALARAAGNDLGLPLETLRVDGGLTRSDRLMQIQADLLQIPVQRSATPEATAVGVGALARLGAGAVATAAQAVGPWTPAATFAPTIDAGEAARRCARYEAAARAAIEMGNG